MYEEDTIAAIATPPGEGALAIVRISGISAESIARQIFIRSQGKQGALKSHVLYHGRIRDPKSQRDVDDVLLTVMRKPRSYTGEDVVEVHCHGGAFLVRQLLGLILAQGARQAEPGEFTKRAFLNGRIDLAQAEAVLDLIRAPTIKGAELALNQMSGELSQFVVELREELLDILVQVEAAIDFPEEEIELLQRQQLIAKVDRLSDKISTILDSYEWGKLFREGARVCICGRPNVGKSSLLNALLGEERAIVTSIPGTTRDVIEEAINLDGLPVVLWDTAVIRESENEIEQLGVERSRRHLAQSDALILMLDGSAPLTQDDLHIIREVQGKKHLTVINKTDLPLQLVIKGIDGDESLSPARLVSALSGDGIASLKSALRELLLDCRVDPPVAVTNIRHRSELLRSKDALAKAMATISDNFAPELVAVDLIQAREALEEIIGLVNNEDILERIFSNFCVGK